MLRGHVPVEVFEPRAIIERQALHGPLILGEDPHVRPRSLEHGIRRRILRDLRRHGVPERVVDVAGDMRLGVVDALFDRNTALERVGSRDVGDREPLCLAVNVPERAVGRLGVVLKAGRKLQDRNIVGAHAGREVRGPPGD